MDRTTLAGLLLGALALFGGHYLEGGSPAMILQATAGVIVLGGTLGAVCLSFSGEELRQSLKELPNVWRHPRDDTPQMVSRLVQLAYRARREGLLALEGEVAQLKDPFLRRSLELVIDGYPAPQVREIMEMELTRLEEVGQIPAKVFEAAGGYAPTIGILGAVLGLIQVMQHLTDPARLGTGVAVAFVATIYGVASANLLFLPIAHKLRLRQQQRLFRHELLLEGVLSLAQGEPPRSIAEKLNHLLPKESATPIKSPPPREKPPLIKTRLQGKSRATTASSSH
uniref:Flagellar motor protein n=1 Tax=Desulfobacca acetoxidans TaxID=60893 RepID=A0A7C5EMX7_9BACT